MLKNENFKLDLNNNLSISEFQIPFIEKKSLQNIEQRNKIKYKTVSFNTRIDITNITSYKSYNKLNSKISNENDTSSNTSRNIYNSNKCLNLCIECNII